MGKIKDDIWSKFGQSYKQDLFNEEVVDEGNIFN
jgi:hypothetical protein